MYKTSKLEISQYISKNKSYLDLKSNMGEIENMRALYPNKGSKCTCITRQRGDSALGEKTCGPFCKNLSP